VTGAQNELRIAVVKRGYSRNSGTCEEVTTSMPGNRSRRKAATFSSLAALA
jgi:hypothetical protein